MTAKEIYFLNENTDLYEVEKVVIKYIREFNYTKSHVSLYKNDEYTLTIYIENKCIQDLGLEIPEIDFGSCYAKIKNASENNNEFIIAIIDKNIGKNERKVIKYGLFSIKTGKYLNSDEICKEEKIMVTENIEQKIIDSGVDIEAIKELVNDGVDVFNVSSPFYHDICFQYNFKKDVPLKDRVFEFFPNISLCEEGCDFLGINMTTITSICNCFFSTSKKEADLKDKVLEQSQIGFVEDMISSSNIYVVKCIYLLTTGKALKKCYGGFLILCLVIAEIICTVVYCKKNIYSINKYIFSITKKFVNNLLQHNNKTNEKEKINDINNTKKVLVTKNENNNNNAPPRKNSMNSNNYINSVEKKFLGKRKSARKTVINGNINLVINNNKNREFKNNFGDKKNNNNICINNNGEKTINKSQTYMNKLLYQGNPLNLDSKDLISSPKSEVPNESNDYFPNIKDDLNINIVEYLKTQYDDMDYDEAIRKDHRKFSECFTEKIKTNHLIINTIWVDEYIKPKSIKILLLILQFILYFFINGLFYDEEYIGKIYHLEKDTFFTMAERFFDNLLYAAFAGIIINYIIEFFFVEEIKIKKILKMEKDNIFILKYEIIKILKSIKQRYLIFTIITFIISFIALIHIFCFNVVYFHTMKEWFAFSLIIILSIQIGSLLVCLLQTALRFLSFKFKSEKLFKLSV